MLVYFSLENFHNSPIILYLCHWANIHCYYGTADFQYVSLSLHSPHIGSQTFRISYPFFYYPLDALYTPKVLTNTRQPLTFVGSEIVGPERPLSGIAASDKSSYIPFKSTLWPILRWAWVTMRTYRGFDFAHHRMFLRTTADILRIIGSTQSTTSPGSHTFFLEGGKRHAGVLW